VGPDGLIAQLTKRVLEKAMQAEVSEHLGYEDGDRKVAGCQPGKAELPTEAGSRRFPMGGAVAAELSLWRCLARLKALPPR
jgi:hypothetical protein